MRVSEKDPQQKFITEALIELSKTSIAQKKQSNLPKLPKEWVDRAAGNRVVLYYAGRDSFKGLEPLKALQLLQGKIYRLVKLFCHVQGFLLWWYDDGLVNEFIRLSDENERQKMEEAYTEAVRYCQQNICALHDDSGDVSRAIGWADAFYGDESSLFQRFRQTGRRAFLQTWKEDYIELEEWLRQICMVKQNKNLDLPYEWSQAAIGRKIILLRLSAKTFLEEEKRTIDLLACLLDYIDNREDICLWWLVNKKEKALLPLLSEEARCRIHDMSVIFRKNPYAIYDESDNYERALSYADVCFGDGWHEIGIFKNLNQKVLKPEYSKLKSLPICLDVREIWQENQKIWFIYNEREAFGALCEADLETDQVKVICDVPNDESHIGWGLDYYVIGKTGTKFIMAPYFSGEFFFEYDFATGKSCAVPCKEIVWQPNNDRFAAFHSRASWQGDLYFLGNGNGLIVQYRARDGQYVYHRAWASSLEKRIPREKLNFAKAIQKGSFWHMVLRSENLWVTLNLMDMTVQVQTIPLPTGFMIAGVAEAGQEFWLLPQKGNQILRWQPSTGDVESFLCPNVSASQNYPFAGIADRMGKKLLFPYWTSSIQVFENGKDVAFSDELLTDKLVYTGGASDIRLVLSAYMEKGEGRQYFTQTNKGNVLVEFSDCSDTVKYHKLCFTAEDAMRLNAKVTAWNQKHVLKELQDTIDGQTADYRTDGQRIWQAISAV